ncbi:hypothetical protein L3X38_033236 [Prunus dulcis]|uniref:Tf2-1-like SH3-like domain-containing protein n=1 Tax=Prunus dulcis TaxID=3755 RepID=A0AAD4VGP9_PRUDU|nr:hypothetical protein L3X38_033236 [Prunus dulcis]
MFPFLRSLLQYLMALVTFKASIHLILIRLPFFMLSVPTLRCLLASLFIISFCCIGIASLCHARQIGITRFPQTFTLLLWQAILDFYALKNVLLVRFNGPKVNDTSNSLSSLVMSASETTMKLLDLMVSYNLFPFLKLRERNCAAPYPQSDGRTEVLNPTVEHYLRCFIDNEPSTWVHWLPWAELWYNTTFQAAIKMSPYEALYGVPLPIVHQYLQGTSLVQAIDQTLHQHDQLVASLCTNMLQAQNRMKLYVDQHRTEREFNIGDWVYLRIQPYRQTSIAAPKNFKLSPEYYGPYQVEAHIGKTAYHLRLPPSTKFTLSFMCHS